MDDRQALLRTIADHPDDDGPRLIYADWLEERGEGEWAELIRVQCQIAKWGLCPGSPHGPPGSDPTPGCVCATRSAFRDRERELKSTVLAWAESLGNDPRTKYALDRGFLVMLASGADFLKRYGDRFSEHPIHSVRLLDWLGVNRSLPPNPSTALPFLKHLEIPRTPGNDPTDDLPAIRRLLPGVEVVVSIDLLGWGRLRAAIEQIATWDRRDASPIADVREASQRARSQTGYIPPG